MCSQTAVTGGHQHENHSITALSVFRRSDRPQGSGDVPANRPDRGNETGADHDRDEHDKPHSQIEHPDNKPHLLRVTRAPGVTPSTRLCFSHFNVFSLAFYAAGHTCDT